MKKIEINKKYKIINKIINGIKEDHISEYSAQCSYYTILSFIPFIILLITLIQYTNIEQETLFNIISKLVPTNMSDIVLGIVREVYSKSVGTISISIVFTLWSAGNGLLALTKGLHAIYKVKDKKSNSIIYLKFVSIFKTIIFIILIVLGLVLLVFWNSLISIAQNKFETFIGYNIISSILTEIGFIFGTFIVFLCLYKFIPRYNITFKSQILGAGFAAISLNIVSFIFSKYLDIFKGFSITYGSLTTLMLIMMWIYFCFYMILLGAEINKIFNIEQ